MEKISKYKGPYRSQNDIDAVYGLENNYYFTMEASSLKNLMVIAFSVSNADATIDEIAELRTDHPAIAFGGVYKDGLKLLIEVNQTMLTSTDEPTEIIKEVALILGYHDCRNICSVHGSENNIGIFRVGRRLSILDEETFESQSKIATINRKPSDKINGGSFLGYVGAVGGLILGMLIWIALGYVGFIAGIAGYFMIKFAIQGFEKLGGELNRRSGKIIIGMTIFAIFLAQILNIALSAAIALGDVSLVGNLGFLKVIMQITFSTQSSLLRFLLDMAIGLGLTYWSASGIFKALWNLDSNTTKKARYKSTRLL